VTVTPFRFDFEARVDKLIELWALRWNREVRAGHPNRRVGGIDRAAPRAAMTATPGP
jgi:hypothetical protein